MSVSISSVMLRQGWCSFTCSNRLVTFPSDSHFQRIARLFWGRRDSDDDVTTPEIEIQNIVSSGDFGHTLNLCAIAIGLGLEHVEYEPEQFPGLVYRLDDPDVVALLFGSGIYSRPRFVCHSIQVGNALFGCSSMPTS